MEIADFQGKKIGDKLEAQMLAQHGSFTHFGAKDVVRHPLVQKIVLAYEKYEKQQ